jgi:hypothetical protein
VPNRIIGLLGYPAGRINLDSVVIREHALGITLEERYDPRELFRHRLVIGVQESQIFTAGYEDGDVARSRFTGSRLVNCDNPVAVMTNHVDGAIGRTVIDDITSTPPVSPDRARDRSRLRGTFAIADRDDYGDAWARFAMLLAELGIFSNYARQLRLPGDAVPVAARRAVHCAC